MSAYVPQVDPEADTLTAALAYAAAGLYVGPVKARTKHPAGVLGKGWPRLTSTDPEVIASWFAGTDHGVMLHAGRSGLLVLDVDTPQALHPLVRRALDELHPPYQSTRAGEVERGHYLFAMPPGRVLGNSLGALASGWGEVRGRNGLIVVAPSVHEHPEGAYVWRRTGPVPALPGYLADALPDALPTAEAVATSGEVATFLDAHTGTERPGLLDVHCRAFQRAVSAGESRHHTMTGHLAGAMREAAAGLLDARTAADTLESLFLPAVTSAPTGSRQGAARGPAQARTEWAGLLAWAIAQAQGADTQAVRARVAAHVGPAAGLDPGADLGTLGERAVELATSEALPRPVDAEDAPSVPEDDRAAVRARFPRLSLAALLAVDRPEREWVLHGLIPAGASVSLVAPAGTGKSLVLLGLCLALARGRAEFAGLTIPRRRRMLLVDMENTEDDLADRLTALGVDADEAARLDAEDVLVPIHLPPLAPLDTATGAAELAAILAAYDVSADDVAILDSLQRVTQGPENDSDTYRAYYRHTGMMLKRHGLTVIRTDNTGKDADKGARGSSGKRDDVDVELILTRDGEHEDRLRIKPGKVRLPGIAPVLIRREVDEDGHLTFSTAADPFRVAVRDALTLLDALDVDTGTGERKAVELIRESGHQVPKRVALRAAIKERNSTPTGAPSTLGAPTDDGARRDSRRTPGAPTDGADVSAGQADKAPRQTQTAHLGAAVHSDGAPPPPPYRGGAPAHLPETGVEDTATCPTCGEQNTPTRDAAGLDCLTCYERTAS